ncbi:hypothetical protein Ancab_001182 [Ancistrocladus abbreviatus]
MSDDAFEGAKMIFRGNAFPQLVRLSLESLRNLEEIFIVGRQAMLVNSLLLLDQCYRFKQLLLPWSVLRFLIGSHWFIYIKHDDNDLKYCLVTSRGTGNFVNLRVEDSQLYSGWYSVNRVGDGTAVAL